MLGDNGTRHWIFDCDYRFGKNPLNETGGTICEVSYGGGEWEPSLDLSHQPTRFLRCSCKQSDCNSLDLIESRMEPLLSGECNVGCACHYPFL